MQTKPSRLKTGVIGLGILGEQYVRFFREHAATELVAVADVRSDVLQRIAAQTGAQAFDDCRALLKAHKLDLVAVATPDPLHRDPALAVVEAGVPNVILEKPLTTTLDDAQALCEAVERRGTRLFVNFANRAAPLEIASHYVIRQGLLGPVVYGEARLDDNIIVPTGLWGERSREWAAGSSTAHFLLSHVVDLLHWHFAPAAVREVYAITQAQVLGFTPDLYDAYLTFDTGMKVRVKAEWIKHIDELVEFYVCFSGRDGTLVHNKRGGFGTAAGWRANVADTTTAAQLVAHQEALLARGVKVAALLHRPEPVAGLLSAGGDALKPALELRSAPADRLLPLVARFVDAILEDTLTPVSWHDNGPLPTHIDGLRQVQVVAAIIESARSGRVVNLG